MGTFFTWCYSGCQQCSVKVWLLSVNVNGMIVNVGQLFVLQEFIMSYEFSLHIAISCGSGALHCFTVKYMQSDVSMVQCTHQTYSVRPCGLGTLDLTDHVWWVQWTRMDYVR